jgi:hypothetical protein
MGNKSSKSGGDGKSVSEVPSKNDDHEIPEHDEPEQKVSKTLTSPFFFVHQHTHIQLKLGGNQAC